MRYTALWQAVAMWAGGGVKEAALSSLASAEQGCGPTL